jgi:hypothetical protein
MPDIIINNSGKFNIKSGLKGETDVSFKEDTGRYNAGLMDKKDV